VIIRGVQGHVSWRVLWQAFIQSRADF
jgi:hypothetical protein